MRHRVAVSADQRTEGEDGSEVLREGVGGRGDREGGAAQGLALPRRSQ